MMRSPRHGVKAFLTGQEGASLVEYGLLIAMFSVVALATLLILGHLVNGAFGKLQKAVSPRGGGNGPFRPI